MGFKKKYKAISAENVKGKKNRKREEEEEEDQAVTA